MRFGLGQAAPRVEDQRFLRGGGRFTDDIDLAYNLGNFMRTLALPKEVEHWSLTTLREKLVKIGAKVVRHGRYVTFQLAEVTVSKSLFQKILALIDDLRRSPVPA